MMDQQHPLKPRESGANEGNNRKRNRPEPLRNLSDNANDEYKPFDNGYNSPLSSPIIKEKIESVLHFASAPLVENDTAELLLYETWQTPTRTTPPENLFSVEDIQQRERSSSFQSQPLFKYLSVASGYSISNRPAQFDSFTPNLNSLLFDTPPVTPTSHSFVPCLSSSLFGTSLITSTSYSPPRKSESNLRSIKPSSSNEACGYCIATCKFPQNHNKKECPKLACMKPCKICNASGNDNHTLMHCPLREKVVLKLKDDKRNNADMNNTDNENDKNDEDNNDNKDD